MRPITPQKTLKQDLNRLALLVFVVFPVLTVLAYIGLAQLLGFLVFLAIPVILLALIITYMVMLHAIYKTHGFKHPVLATISGAAILGVVNIIATNITNIVFNSTSKSGAEFLAVNPQSYWIIVIVAALIELVISYFVFKYVLGKFIPGLAYFAPDPVVTPAAPVAAPQAPVAPPVAGTPQPLAPNTPVAPPEQPPVPPTPPVTPPPTT